MHRSTNPNADDSDDDNDEEEEGYQSELETILESVTRRMIKSELEDFELVLVLRRDVCTVDCTLLTDLMSLRETDTDYFT